MLFGFTEVIRVKVLHYTAILLKPKISFNKSPPLTRKYPTVEFGAYLKCGKA